MASRFFSSISITARLSAIVAPPNITRTRRSVDTKTMSSDATGRSPAFSMTRSSSAFAMVILPSPFVDSLLKAGTRGRDFGNDRLQPAIRLARLTRSKTRRGTKMFHRDGSVERAHQEPAKNGRVLEELDALPLPVDRILDLPEGVPGDGGRNNGHGERQRGKPRHYAGGQAHPSSEGHGGIEPDRIHRVARRERDDGGDLVDDRLRQLGARLRIRQHIQPRQNKSAGDQGTGNGANDPHRSTVERSSLDAPPAAPGIRT